MAKLPTFAAVVDIFRGTPTAGDAGEPGPVREASPQSDDAQPTTDVMISRDTWIPNTWLAAIKANDDHILKREGGRGIKLYDALLDDEVAFSSLQQRRLAITSRDWEVSPGDPDDLRSKQAADDFRDMLKGIGFDRVTNGLHYGVWYGYAVGEAMWTTKVNNGRSIVWLDDIIIPDRRWFGFTHQGELRLTSSALASIQGEVLPDNKFVTVRTGGTHDFAFYGTGLAHWCYWPIFFKRAALRFWALYLEKLGQPTVAIEFPETEAGTDAESMTKRAKRLQAASAVGKDSAVLLPAGTLTGDMIKILESTRAGTSGSGYSDFLTEQNDALMRIVLGQPGTSKGVSSGLNSDQADVHADVKAEIVKADADMICEALNSTVATWVTRWNYGPDVKPPTVYRVLDDVEDLNDVADRDVKLAGIGIKRTKESVSDVYGDGYEIDPTLPVASSKQVAQVLGGVIDPETGLPIKEAPTPTPGAAPAFTADEEDAIERLASALADQTNPVIEAMANHLRDNLEGVTTVDGARVALLDAFESMPADRLAKMTGLAMLAIRAAGEDIEA